MEQKPIRALMLEENKGLGWWAEYHPETKTYRLMKSRNVWINITLAEFNWFRAVSKKCILVKDIEGTTYKGRIEYAWSNLPRLKSIEVDLETEITDFLSVSARGGHITDKLTETILIRVYVSLFQLRKRIKLLTPPPGKIRTWKEFLNPQ